MGSPQLEPEQIQWAVGAVAEYIRTQRAHFAPRAAPLSASQHADMAGFFSPAVLETRLLVLNHERVANPGFYPELQALGFRDLPGQADMAAITFVDVVVPHVRFSNGLLFHELVHAEQYRQLGIDRFSHLYVTGFLSGGSYERIPLEMHAYELGAAYEAAPQQFFSVEERVADHIRRKIY